MPQYDVGVETQYNQRNAIITPLQGVAINYGPNRVPLFSRLDASPLGTVSHQLVSSGFRTPTLTINEGATLTAIDTTMTVTDGSSVMVGDIYELGTELVLVTAVSGNDLTITRAYAGTTGATH